jgi:hypothetical protein
MLIGPQIWVLPNGGRCETILEDKFFALKRKSPRGINFSLSFGFGAEVFQDKGISLIWTCSG